MINEFKCVKVGGNTGFGDCYLLFEKVAGFILVWKDFALSAADLATDADLLEALQDAAAADLASNRAFPVHGLLDIADNTNDPTIQTYGYGPSVIVREGNYDVTFTFGKGGICLLNALRTFNQSDIRVIFYDSNNTLIGHKVGDTLKGIPLDMFYAMPWKFNTGAAVSATQVRFNFKPKYLNEQLGFYKISDFDMEVIEGLQNVVLKQTGAQAAPAYKVQALVGCSKQNIYDQFSVQLANIARWTARNAATGAAITIASVVVDANIKGFTITLDDDDPDYPVAGTIALSLAAPSVLSAAGVTGYEGLPLNIVNA